MSSARRGSILATSISLVTVFLTLVLGGMAYVQSSNDRMLSDKFRGAAEQAARTGLDFVMGFGEANIDKETRLPVRWSSMSDGEIIDPVHEALGQPSAGTYIDELTAVTKPGEVIGDNVHEYVVGKQGNYITTFKARIQQFRVSDNMPRQYRIGVIGRVRKLQPTVGPRAAFNNINNFERESILAERVILTYVGKEPVSKYAALIDMDAVGNWVPGEIIDGPVHINRGYVDELPARNISEVFNPSGTAHNVDGVTSSGPVRLLDIRSKMKIWIDDPAIPGNVGFRQPAGGLRHPQFNREVTVTEIPSNELGNPTNTALGIRGADFANSNTPVDSNVVLVNGKPWKAQGANSTPSLSAYHTQIFRAPENASTDRYGAKRYGDVAANTVLRGPVPVPYPIALPRSVRNRIGGVVGAPPGATSFGAGAEIGKGWDRWKNLPDGLYVFTERFWAVTTTTPQTEGIPTDAYSPAVRGKLVSGVYVRGNVEIMRMAVGGTNGRRSHYLFQLGPGANVGGVTSRRRVYVVSVDRAARTMKIIALPNSGNGAETNMDLMHSIMLTSNLDAFVDGINPSAASANPNSFAIWPSGAPTATTSCIEFTGVQQNQAFNGIIYVDCAKDDPARAELGAPGLRSTPTTGNIYSLGDPGQPTSANGFAAGTSKRPLNTNVNNDNRIPTGNAPYEAVATFDMNGGDAARPWRNGATKLTIMARGNIFIQNHIILYGLVRENYVNNLPGTGIGANAISNIQLGHCNDLLGLVSDKQIVMGLAAPSDTTRTNAGCVVTAAIAALGDPGFNYQNAQTLDNDKIMPRAEVGSFTTEGLVQIHALDENYTAAFRQWAGAGDFANAQTAPTGSQTWFTHLGAAGLGARLGYPGNPFYGLPGVTNGFFINSTFHTNNSNNPNKQPTRGKLRIIGAITQKRRGIIGVGNQSYDKDFVFDKRLLSIAPPIFPASLNIVVKTQNPFSPDPESKTTALRYRGMNGTPGGLPDVVDANPKVGGSQDLRFLTPKGAEGPGL